MQIAGRVSFRFIIVLLLGALALSGCTFSISKEKTDSSTDPKATIAVVLASVSPSPNSLSTIPVTIDFGSVAVTGLDASDFVVVNGSVSNLAGSGTSYTIDLNPTGSGNFLVSIRLPKSVAASAAGDTNASSNTLTFMVNKSGPTLAIVGPAITSGTSATSFVFTVNYTNATTVTLADGDIVLGGTDSAGCTAVVTGAGAATRTVTVSGCTGDGTMNISIAANSAEDALGNQALAFGPSSSATLRNAFIVRFDTTKVSAGSSANNQVALPLTSWLTYNITVDWGDSQSDTIALGGDPEATHTYATAGIYNIKIKGSVPLFQFSGSGDRLKILDVKQWGTSQWWSMELMFAGCENLQMSATDAPDLSNVTNLTGMFSGALIFNGAIGHWNTSNVTDMHTMFGDAKAFNQPIGSWDVSKVEDLRYMFGGAEAFNQDISAWNTSSVTDMSGMFFEAKAFNKPINTSSGHWDTSSVTAMAGMFMSAIAFNQDIKDWDTSSLTNMDGLFLNASAFDRDLSSWSIDSNTVSYINYDSGATSWAPGHKPTFLP